MMRKAARKSGILLVAVALSVTAVTAGPPKVEDLIGKTVVITSISSSSYVFNQDTRQMKLVKYSRKPEQYAFKIVKGLGDPRKVSFESVAKPGHYMRQQIGQIRLSKDDTSEGFKGECTFKIDKGLSGGSKAVTLRPMLLPDEYVHVTKKKEIFTEFKPQGRKASFYLKEVKIKEKK